MSTNSIYPARARWMGACVLGLSMAAALATPAEAAQTCRGQRNPTPVIAQLGVDHPFTKPFKTMADLQARMPELESDFRAVMAQGGLDEATIDAVIAALRSGEGVTETTIGRNTKTPLKWMAYRCAGKPLIVTTPTLQLAKSYSAFELTVQVPDPETPVEPASCKIVVDRNCAHENPTIRVDVTGSDDSPVVTMTADDGSKSAVSGEGTNWSMADPAPYEHDYTFAVTATKAGAPERGASIYRFLIPRACGNIALVADPERTMIAQAQAPRTCTEQVEVAMCDPWCVPSVAASEIEVHHDVQVSMSGGWADSKAKLSVSGPAHSTPLSVDQAPYQASYNPAVPTKDCTDPYQVTCHAENAAGKSVDQSASLTVTPHEWVARGFVFVAKPTDDKQSENLFTTDDSSFAGARETYEIDDAKGVGFSLEKKITPVVGVEGALLRGVAKTKFSYDSSSISGSDDHNANFSALTVGPNFHLLRCKAADLYVGPFIGYGGLSDPNYWVGLHHFHAKLESKFLWGATLGLDVPFDPAKDWGFHGGVRYMKFDEKTDLGTIDVDPWVVEIGLSKKF